MNKAEIHFNHPYDHINFRHIGIVPNTCFVLMPFDEKFTLAYETIVDSLKGLMVCKRADDLPMGYSILERIITGIRSSELIIADLSGTNPNVYYELGIAHTQNKNVLLLSQNINDVPFDLRGLFCHSYSLNSIEAIYNLKETVKSAAKEVRSQRIPDMLEGSIVRTSQIVDYMNELLNSPRSPQSLIIRIQAGLSSLSNLGYSESGGRDIYVELLEKERNYLINLIEQGATLQAILCPPKLPDNLRTQKYWRERFDLLIHFLTNCKDLLEQCEFVISTDEGPNLFFFEEDILFEGHKTGLGPGYGWTMIYTDPKAIEVRLKIYDMWFESSRNHTLITYRNNIKEDRKSLSQAVSKAIITARDGRWKK